MSWNAVLRSAVAFALMLGVPGFALADVIMNGSFESVSATQSSSYQISDTANGPDSMYPTYVTVYGWARGGPNTWVQTAATDTIMESPVTSSPDGGNFLAVDGASSYQSSVSQMVTGLNVGDTYQLLFYDGAGQQTGVPAADLTDHFVVSFGSQTQDGMTYMTSNYAFSGWNLETMDFVASSSSEMLTFLAAGMPNLPPYMVLDGVSMTDISPSAVPEPSSIVLMGMSCLTLAGLYIRRRIRFKAAAV